MEDLAPASIAPVAPASAESFVLAPQHRFVWILLIAVILGLFGAAIVNRVNGEANKLPVRGTLNDFTFTDQSNNEVTLKTLKGHVWLAGFIFTRCAGTCQTITNGMVELNKKLADNPRVQLVSISMDPEYDSPAMLQAYAQAHAATSPRWHFVTGPKEQIFHMTRDDFKLAVVEAGQNKDEPIIHSSLLALIDQKGRIRGYYDGLQSAEVANAAADARKLDSQLGIASLPALNAGLNGLCTIFLLIGFVLIRQRRIIAHQTFMMTAGVTSAAFLTSYLIYHYNVGSVKFTGEGTIRYVYFFILITHVVLAGVIGVLVPLTFWRAFQGNFVRHRKIARVTYPIWLYVSITGVVVYLMLYQLYPAA
jgi:protein SCO1/2